MFPGDFGFPDGGSCGGTLCREGEKVERMAGNMLIFRKGCEVPFPKKLNEGYQINENGIVANVNADKICDVVQHFICMHDEPLFFILELPAKKENEIERKQGVFNKLHKDVYYIDGCTVEDAMTIVIRVGALLTNDGVCAFGFGGHNSNDEIMVDKYCRFVKHLLH